MGRAREQAWEEKSWWGRRGVGSLADVGSRSFGTAQKLFCRGRNPAGPEQVVRVPIRALADRKTQR